MATSPELLPHHYLRRKRRTGHRVPEVSYQHLENVNSLIAQPHQPDNPDDSRPVDWRLNLAIRTIGEGYVTNYSPYRERVKQLKQQKKRMSSEEYSGFVDLVSEQMAEDRYARGGHAITLCEFAYNGKKDSSNLAVTGRLVSEDLEIDELIEPFPREGVICELGRIVVAEEYRGTWPDGRNQTTELIHNFIDGPNGVIEIAQQLDCDTIETMAKEQFIKHTRGTRLDFEGPYEYTLTPKGLAVAQTYEGYWYDTQDPPRRYRAQVPPAQAE